MSSTGNKIPQNDSRDHLTKDSILSALHYPSRDNLYVLDSIDSTNNYLKKLEAGGASTGTVVIADHQTNGRGRRGRNFISPEGEGIYISYLFRPESDSTQLSKLTGWVAVAISDAIKNAYNIDIQIKWVNDLLINRKKIGGILTELTNATSKNCISACIIGIGINVNESGFPEELSEIATSLSIENGSEVFDRSVLASEIIKAMDKLCKDWPENAYYLKRYRELNITTGNKITAFPLMTESGNGLPGTALSINDDFSLKVRFDDGTEKDLNSGEVSVRGIYGYT